jgi:hypothetical protein
MVGKARLLFPLSFCVGVPSSIQPHELTDTLVYEGPVMNLAAAMADLPSGGQVLLSPTAFSSIAARLPEVGLKAAVGMGRQTGPPGAATSYMEGRGTSGAL